MNINKTLGKGSKLRKVLRARSPVGAILAALHYAFPAKSASFAACKAMVEGRSGLEIGGPSPGFGPGGFLPIYPMVAGLDNCNFGTQTVWEGSISSGLNFQYDPNRPKGRQFIAEATSLPMIADESYDFILSCHSLEHTANPLLALKEWNRLLKKQGRLILILPHKEDTFDHRRPVTTLEHLVADFQNNTGENDQTHIEEVLKFHDLDKDWGSPDFESFERQCRNNLENRCLHHHVFDTELVARIVDHAGMQIETVEALMPFHAIVAGRKLAPGAAPQNEVFLSGNAEWRRKSPFKIDRGPANDRPVKG